VALLDGRLLKDRSAAFELFRKSYKRNAAIEDNKAVRGRCATFVSGSHLNGTAPV
jgi:hypothetical protein